MSYGILVDVTLCTGCERCADACVEANRLDRRRASIDRLIARDGLSANRLLSVRQAGEGRFVRMSCNHCLDPSCVSACLVGGLTKSAEGPVIYDADKCIGCRYCMLACPWQIPRYQWSRTLPLVRKCDMCVERLREGLQPACVEACPTGALTFGDREELLEEAHRRIQDSPGRYLDRVWGEVECGGTSVLCISDVDLGALGWPSPDAGSIPSLTEPLVAKTPAMGLSVALGLLGINWILGRRMKIAEETRLEGTDTGASESTGESR